MDPPVTQYVERAGAALAFQVTGSGPLNLITYLEVPQHLDLMWTDPHAHRNMERLASGARSLLLQRRGFGLSDPVPYIPTLEQQAEDLLAVMDAADVDRAWLCGMWSTSGPVAMAAACAPERVSGILLYGTVADGWPVGGRRPSGGPSRRARASMRSSRRCWTTGARVAWPRCGAQRLMRRTTVA